MKYIIELNTRADRVTWDKGHTSDRVQGTLRTLRTRTVTRTETSESYFSEP